MASTVDYYVATRQIAAGPAVAQRGRDAGQALGDDPVAAVAQIASRVLPLVAGLDGTELLTTIAGGMRIADYLPTRVFELVVHTADLAVALGVPAEPPPGPAALALGLVVRPGDRRRPRRHRAAGQRPDAPGCRPGFTVL